MAYQDPYEQGGITGGIQAQLVKALQGGTATAQAPGLQPSLPIDPKAVPIGDDMPAPPVTGTLGGGTPAAEDYTQLGKYANRLGAFAGNTDKLGRGWDDKSERYKMLTVQSHFDPNQGITPELIAALNGANINGAKFSGGKDKLTVDNAGNYARFGTGGTGDIIEGFNDPNNTQKQWGAWQVDDQPQGQAGPPRGGMNSGMPSFGGSNINGMLQSDAQGNIQQALSSLQQPGLLQQLIAQLQGAQ